MRSIAGSVILGLLLLTPGWLVAQEANPGLDELRGSWKLISHERNGEKLEAEDVVCTFGGSMFETKKANKAIESGTIKVDASKSPKSYDVVIMGNFKEKGSTYYGIYEVDGDILKTCVNSDVGGGRPDEFMTKPGSGHRLMVWKMIKTQNGKSEERQKVVRFLKREVLGKPLYHHSVSKIDGGKVEVDYSRTLTFANCIETENGFMFDIFFDIKQINYDIDNAGSRKGTSTSKDRSLVMRFEVRERTSTGQLLGFCHTLANSLMDSSGQADHVQLQMEGNRLKIKRSTIGYYDSFSSENTYKPGASDEDTEIFVLDSKLQHVQKIQLYEVDPVSLKRTPNAEPDTMLSQEKK